MKNLKSFLELSKFNTYGFLQKKKKKLIWQILKSKDFFAKGIFYKLTMSNFNISYITVIQYIHMHALITHVTDKYIYN